MTMNNDHIEAYWWAYLATFPSDSALRKIKFTAERFGDTPELADRLGALIVEGTKTATCSALWEWEAEDSPIPEAGMITIVLDGADEPLCIIETIEVIVQPFNQVDARFAYEEGEGDRSLQYWREAHWDFFTRSLAKIGKKPTFEMPLVCERFRVIHK